MTSNWQTCYGKSIEILSLPKCRFALTVWIQGGCSKDNVSHTQHLLLQAKVDAMSKREAGKWFLCPIHWGPLPTVRAPCACPTAHLETKKELSPTTQSWCSFGSSKHVQMSTPLLLHENASGFIFPSRSIIILASSSLSTIRWIHQGQWPWLIRSFEERLRSLCWIKANPVDTGVHLGEF